MLRMFRRAFKHALLCLLLLLLQHESGMHTIAHVFEGSAQSHEKSPLSPAQHHVCAACLSFGAAGAPLAASPLRFEATAQTCPSYRFTSPSFIAIALSAYHSRAPPLLA